MENEVTHGKFFGENIKRVKDILMNKKMTSIDKSKNFNNLIEGNKLIATFMGIDWSTVNGKLILSSDKGKSWYGRLYDEDLNSLMSVVERIESLTNNLKPNGVRLQTTMRSEVPILESDKRKYYYLFAIIFNQHPKFVVEANTRIEAVWGCVVQFIQWYNEQ